MKLTCCLLLIWLLGCSCSPGKRITKGPVTGQDSARKLHTEHKVRVSGSLQWEHSRTVDMNKK